MPASDIVEVSANYTIEASVSTVVVDATSGNVDLTLPDIVPRRGISITIVRIDNGANIVRLYAMSGQTCASAAYLTVPKNESIVVISPVSGTDWKYESRWTAAGGAGAEVESQVVLAWSDSGTSF